MNGIMPIWVIHESETYLGRNAVIVAQTAADAESMFIAQFGPPRGSAQSLIVVPVDASQPAIIYYDDGDA